MNNDHFGKNNYNMRTISISDSTFHYVRGSGFEPQPPLQ